MGKKDRFANKQIYPYTIFFFQTSANTHLPAKALQKELHGDHWRIIGEFLPTNVLRLILRYYHKDILNDWLLFLFCLHIQMNIFIKCSHLQLHNTNFTVFQRPQLIIFRLSIFHFFFKRIFSSVFDQVQTPCN